MLLLVLQTFYAANIECLTRRNIIGNENASNMMYLFKYIDCNNDLAIEEADQTDISRSDLQSKLMAKVIDVCRDKPVIIFLNSKS